METIEYEIMYTVEDHHWWYRGMAAISRALLQRYIPSRKNLKILDAGCGTGAAMQTFLSEKGSVTGVDSSMIALDYCHLRTLKPLVNCSIENLPFTSASFDLVTSFDVMYAQTVIDVPSALRDLTRVLVPRGYLLIRLPAYDWLRGQHDIAVGTARRFTLQKISELLEKSDLTILHKSYANTFLFPLALIKRIFDNPRVKNTKTSDLSIRYGVLDKIFGKVLSLEATLVSRFCFPFGLSLMVMAQKK